MRRGERRVGGSETVQFAGDRVAMRKQGARHGLTQLPVKYAELLKKLEGLEGD